MKNLSVEGSCVFKDGKFVHVQTNVSLGELVEQNIVAIPNYEETKTGKTYQRNKIPLKAQNIGREILKKEEVVFQPLVFNVRTKPIVRNFTGRKSNVRKVVINSRLQCVDGQQRFEGMKFAFNQAQNDDDKFETVKQLQVPVQIKNVGIRDELDDFTRLNGEQKPIAGGHVSLVMFNNIIENKGWDYSEESKTKAIIAGAARELNEKRNSPFYGRIKMTEKESKYQTKVTTFLTAFNGHKGKRVRELLDLESYDIPAEKVNALAHKLFLQINPFWRALRRLLGDIWNLPGEYSLYKNSFIGSMAMLLLEIKREYGNDIKWKEETLYNLLRKSKSLRDIRNWQIGDGRFVKEGVGWKGYDKVSSEILKEIKRKRK